jgi:hypothetical protein
MDAVVTNLSSATLLDIPPLPLIMVSVIASWKVRQCSERVCSNTTQHSLPSFSRFHHQSGSFSSVTAPRSFSNANAKAGMGSALSACQRAWARAGNGPTVVGHD